jgi:DNA-binding transcriptional ArsR family regulator
VTDDEKLIDEVLSGTLDVLRLAASKRREILRRLAKLEKELVDKLATEDLRRTDRAKLARFIKEADRIISEHYTQAQLELDMPGIAQTVADITGDSLKAVLGVDAIQLPLKDYFAAVASNVLLQGVPQADWWNRQTVQTQQVFAGAVRQGLASAETNQQIIARIVGKPRLGIPGVMDITRRNASTLVQTSVQAVANSARLETFRRNSDVIKGVKQISTLDSHTSDICIAYSGATWDLDGKPIMGNKLAFNGGPPRHFNCRSVLVPITKTFKDLGLNVPEGPSTKRASDEGPIAAKTTFDDFLSRKSQAYQDEVLGKGRADLWRAGKITLRDLVSGDGRPLTLQELRQKAGLE